MSGSGFLPRRMAQLPLRLDDGAGDDGNFPELLRQDKPYLQLPQPNQLRSVCSALLGPAGLCILLQGADADESMADLSASHHLSIYADTCSLRVDTSYSICKMGSPWRKESQEL